MSFAADWLLATKRALVGWDPAKHPRGRDGRFLEVGDLVAVFSGPDSGQIDTGTVVAGHYAEDGRFFIAVASSQSGTIKWYRPKQIEQVNPKAVLAPKSPVPDVGSKDLPVPWSAAQATEAHMIQTKTLESIHDAAPEKKAALVNNIGDSAYSGGDPIEGGFSSAAAIAVKQGLASGSGSKLISKAHKSPAVKEGTKGNSLKGPIKLTKGSEWLAAWQLIEDAGGPDATGYGFADNGVDLEVFDITKANASLVHNAAAYMSPVIASLRDQVAARWAAENPGVPMPGTVFPAQNDSEWHGKLKLTNDEMFVFHDIANVAGANWGMELMQDTDSANDTVLVKSKTSAIGHILDFIDNAAAAGYDPGPANTLLDKMKMLPDKPPPVVLPAPVIPPPIKVPGGKTPKDLILNVITSAENKYGQFSPESVKVDNLIDAALSNPDPVAAHKSLATAMTIAKLGGKQRARYKQLLDMHLGVQTPVPQKAPAYTPGTTSSDLLPNKPVGLKPSEALEPGSGNSYVNPGTLTAPAAKRAIQLALSARLKDVHPGEFVKVIHGSPGQSEGDAGTKLAQAWHAGTTKSGNLFLIGGVWHAEKPQWGNVEKQVPATPENIATAVRETAVNALIATWASTSNDNNPRSLALQDLAIDEFSLDSSWVYNWHSKPAQLDEHKKMHEALYRRFLREMYDHTQADFQSKGIKYIKLRRGVSAPPTKKDIGVGLKGVGNTGSIMQRPLSSYSSNLATAKSFGSNVHEAWIPVDRIIGSALTGFGCQHEYEYVILGGPNVVKVVQ